MLAANAIAASRRYAITVLTAGCLSWLFLVPGAPAGGERVGGTIEPIDPRQRHAGCPRTRRACQHNDLRFLLRSGRAQEWPRCPHMQADPHVSRLFVGYGIFAPPKAIEREWKGSKWDMWIDGQRVNLAAFGTTDRTLANYPTCRRQGRHPSRVERDARETDTGAHVRYRTRGPTSTTDTTWTLTVAPKYFTTTVRRLTTLEAGNTRKTRNPRPGRRTWLTASFTRSGKTANGRTRSKAVTVCPAASQQGRGG